MIESQIAGTALAVAAGLAGGLCAAPVKLMKSYRFEHWAFVYSLLGMLLLPWLLAALLCPNLQEAISQAATADLLKANACSLAWGTANVLFCLCLLRIGFSLTMGIVTGLGLPIGVLLPLLFKGSGQFADAPEAMSKAGLMMIAMAALLAVSVAIMAYAGARRERTQGGAKTVGKSYVTGLAMALAAGLLQVGLSFAFVYSQGPLTEALKAQGASETGAVAGVWAATLPGGALANIVFPLALMLKRGSVKDLACARDFALSVLMGLLFVALLLCMGSGMRMLGALGASLGFGLYQGFQTLASQGVGIVSGEWNGADFASKASMAAAILLTLLGVAGMSLAKCL